MMTPEQIEAEFKHLATKEDLLALKTDFLALKADFAQLKVAILEQLIASERAQRGWILGAYGLIFGNYALIIAAVYINHFWR